MPSLQLDIEAELTAEEKQMLARRFSHIYSKIMGSDPNLMTVVIRTLEAGSVWHCTATDPVPGTLLMCNIRAGRNQQTRHSLAEQLIAAIVDATGVDGHTVKIEFTQHTGDEMFHPHLGGFSRDWDESEAPG